MKKFKRLAALLLAAVLGLSGCGFATVEQMYALPKRSTQYHDLQNAIDSAMAGLEYAAPTSGEYQQTVQQVDLDGDGEMEYLLFARGSGEKPLKILIFKAAEKSYQLMETIESRGAAFQVVEYADMDDKPGVELIVGRAVADQVMGAVSVYTFAAGLSEQLISVNYDEFVMCDLDESGLAELMVISQGATDNANAVASLYSYEGGAMVRSAEANLSAPAENIKRIMVSHLSGDVNAVYVASSLAESAVITDVFALKDGNFTNVSFSNESGTSVQTLRNYYVYADDIDDDGVLELPSLMEMTVSGQRSYSAMQYLIRWYAMTIDGEEVTKMYTFHNFDAGWYILLGSHWAHRILVTQEGSTYTFSMWDPDFTEAEKIFTVYTLSGAEREQEALEAGRFILHRTDSIIYCASLEEAAAEYGVNQESLADYFRFIQRDWKTGET